MSQLLLINPGRKVKKMAKHRTKRRSAAQVAATKRLVAFNRSNTPRKKRRSARRSNPIGLSRVAHVSKRRSSRRRNPIGAATSGLMGMGSSALQGAAGALLVNTTLNYVPMLPAALSSGNGKYLTRAVVAVGLGVFGSRVMPKNVAHNMAVGALTVALHDLILGVAAGAMPTLKLGDVGDYDTGVDMLPNAQNIGVGEYELNGIGEYELNGVGDYQLNATDVYAQ